MVFASDKLEIHSGKGKEKKKEQGRKKAEKRKQAMFALSFYIGFFGDCFRPNITA